MKLFNRKSKSQPSAEVASLQEAMKKFSTAMSGDGSIYTTPPAAYGELTSPTDIDKDGVLVDAKMFVQDCVEQNIPLRIHRVFQIDGMGTRSGEWSLNISDARTGRDHVIAKGVTTPDLVNERVAFVYGYWSEVLSAIPGIVITDLADDGSEPVTWE